MAEPKWTLAALLLCIAVSTATAQPPAPAPPPDVIVPPPPKMHGAPGQPDHQAKTGEPGKAYDWTTHRHYTWSCEKKTWIDDESKEEIGYDGYVGENGEIIPPPGLDYDTYVQATQSSADPTHATDAKSGTDLRWDVETHTWKNTKTGKTVLAQGWVLKYCPENVKSIDDMAREDAEYERQKKFMEDHAPPVEVHVDFEYSKFINWNDVAGKVPGAANVDATDSGKGFGGSFFYKPFSLPLYTGVNGFCAFGLDADIKLTNGRESKSDVTDCGGGLDFRFYPRIDAPVKPYIGLGALWYRNSSKYKEFNSSGMQIFSENRDLSSFGGKYFGGMTFWPTPRVGIDIGLSYIGRFRSSNADENFTLSSGLVLRLGKQ